MSKGKRKKTSATKSQTRNGSSQDVSPKIIRAHAPVYFQSLSVRNVRCFGSDAQILNLSNESDGSWSRWTIILGNNGTGKSTLLQLLACVVVRDVSTDEMGVVKKKDAGNPPQGPTRLIGFDHRISYFFSPSTIRRSLIENRSTSGGRANTVSIEYELILTPSNKRPTNSEQVSKPLRFKLLNQFEVTPPDASSSEVGVRGEYKAIGLGDEVSPRLLCVGYGAWRRIGQTTITRTEDAILGPRQHLFVDSSDLLNAEEWLLRLDFVATKMSGKENSYNRIYAHVKETILSLLPGVYEIRSVVSGKRPVQTNVEFRTDFGWVQLRWLGYGYQSLIAWVVDFAARMFEAYPDSDDPLAEPAVCLIDEIDLHLHPSWQRKVMKYLSERFPKTQFIATANSPLIAQAAPEIGANVAVLHRVGDHVVISNNPIDVQGWRADQILNSELFDEVPLRSPEVQKQMDERKTLLAKPKLTKSEQSRLKELNIVAERLPVGSTPREQSVSEQLKNAAELLDRVTSGRS